jgi:hypothetical protein
MDFFARSDNGAAATLAVMVWHLWEARNVVRNEEERKHQYSLAEQIKAYIHIILLHLSKSPSTQRREPKPLPSWASPPDVTAVINVDAALFSSSGRMGVGVVIRSHSGDFLSACSQILDASGLPFPSPAYQFVFS